MLTIRSAEPEDWARYRDARLEALRSAPDAYGSSYERESGFDETTWRQRATPDDEQSCFLAVDDDNTIAGMATGLVDDELAANERLLVAMWIFPEHRGSGLVERLVAAVADWARAAGADTLRLDVTVTNVAAYRAYRRCGFRPTGERHPLPDRPHLLEDVLTRPV